ncbi:MAG: hypothetical protein ABIP12_02740 [Terriglobales bacterium]
MNCLTCSTNILRFILLTAVLLLVPVATSYAQLPDAPSAVKQRADAQKEAPKVTFCQANPFSPLCVVFRAPQVGPEYAGDRRESSPQPTFCDVNPLLPACSGFIPSQPVQVHEVALRRRLVIADGTPVQLRLTSALNSKSVKPGDPVELEVVEDVKIRGAVVIARHARAWATVDLGTRKSSNVGVDFAKFMWKGKTDGNGGKLVLAFNGLWDVTGETIHLRGWTEAQGEDAYVPPEGGVFSLALMFLAKGSNITVPRGAQVTAFVDGNVSLDEALVLRTVPYSERDRARAYAASRQTSIVHVYRATYGSACTELSANLRSSFVGERSPRSELTVAPELFCGAENENYGGKPRIFLDGKEVARLSAGRYASLEIPAGEHVLRADDNELELHTKPGSEDFLRLRARGAFKVKGRLDLMDERSGEDAIFSLEPAAPKHIDADYRWMAPAAGAHEKNAKEKTTDEMRPATQIATAQKEEE